MIEYRHFSEAQIGLEGLKKGLKDKNLKGSVIQDKVNRIYEMKKKYLSEYKPIYIPDIEKKINKKSSQVFIDEDRKKIIEKSNQK
jgi:beta-N-acetylhexosaminidase